MRKKIVVLSGAGISAESGLKTFRGENGLWEGHDVQVVASPEGWHKNPAFVLRFYNERRAQLKTVTPNKAHQLLKDLEQTYDVHIITQNVDDLHERAGSQNILHLHGSLHKMRSAQNPDLVYNCDGDIVLGQVAEDGYQLRPDIVWFGEGVHTFGPAMEIIKMADIVIVIGTSMQVYPAASLVGYATRCESVFYIDPYPSINDELRSIRHKLTIIEHPATIGMQELYDQLMSNQATGN